MTPIDTSVEAEYEDTFILSETEQNDISAYVDCPIIDGVPTGPNTLSDILNKRPEPVHGKLVRFSCFYKDQRYDVDFTTLPDNARPIRFRDASKSIDTDGNVVYHGFHGCRYGYQYYDPITGRNVQEVKEL